MFKKQTGQSPMILGKRETAHGYVSFGLQLVVTLVFANILLFVLWPTLFSDGVLAVWNFPEALQLFGALLMLLSLVVSALAQIQMGRSWRIGIETKEKTDLIRIGLYRYSRNPIYVGMLLAIGGFFLALPNLLSLLAFTMAYFFLQILVRLEEAHLLSIQGQPYQKYCAEVRRWI